MVLFGTERLSGKTWVRLWSCNGKQIHLLDPIFVIFSSKLMRIFFKLFLFKYFICKNFERNKL